MNHSILSNELFSWKALPGELKSQSVQLKMEVLSKITSLETITFDQCNLNNLLKPFEKIQSQYTQVESVLSFYSSVSTQKQLRDESHEVERDLNNFSLEMESNKVIFERLKNIKSEDLDEESRFILEKMIKSRERLGLSLEDDSMKKVKELTNQIQNLCLTFNKNVSDDNSFCSFTLEELGGVPKDLVDSFSKTEEGKFKVTTQYPHVFPCLKYANSPETRKKIEKMFNSRCIEQNTSLLEEIIDLRNKKAKLLGFKNHSSYQLDILMAKSIQNLDKFYQRIIPVVKDIYKLEKSKLLGLKKQHCEKLGISFDGSLKSYDMQFYTRMMKDQECNLDQNLIKEYFPSDHVVKSVMQIYQEMLNLKFEQVDNAPVWSSDVKMFAVRDSSFGSTTKTQDIKNLPIIGYFYVDLYPREGKYSHAACFTFKTRISAQDYAVCALVANFTAPSENKPSLLIHSEVVTLFHEFGHVMHSICCSPQYASLGMYAVERDFIETPSQMLENWAWDENVLRKLSCHHISGKPLSSELSAKLLKSRKISDGYGFIRQIMMAKFDLAIHSFDGRVDTKSILEKMTEEYLDYQMLEGTNFGASFLHLTSGYDSQYYGYLWSLVYSCDIFNTKFQKDVFDTEAGKNYRNFILQPGASKKAFQMLRDFLGREPQETAFFEYLAK